MAHLKRRKVALNPTVQGMESRLAPSGNFLSHGLADVSREVHHLGHHNHGAEHTPGSEGGAHRPEVKAHFDHIVKTK